MTRSDSANRPTGRPPTADRRPPTADRRPIGNLGHATKFVAIGSLGHALDFVTIGNLGNATKFVNIGNLGNGKTIAKIANGFERGNKRGGRWGRKALVIGNIGNIVIPKKLA